MIARLPRLAPALAALVAVLSAAVLALGLLAAPSTAAASGNGAAAQAAGRKPANDFPRMPRHCATPKEKIPATPVICELNKFRDDRGTIVLWGDSHAWMFIPALRKAITNESVNLVAIVFGSCPPMDEKLTPEQEQNAGGCIKSNLMAIDYTQQLAQGDQPLRVVLGSSWQRYLHAVKVKDRESFVGQTGYRMVKGTPRLMKLLGRRGIETSVIGQVATVPLHRASCKSGNQPYACDVARGKALQEERSVRAWVREKMQPLPGNDPAIEVNGAFCTSRVCHGKTDRVRTWFDDLHLSASRSELLSSYFADVVTDVVPSPANPDQPANPDPPCSIPLFC